MDGDGRSRLEETLRDWLRAHPDGGLAVGYSGGSDSTALLAALASLPAARARGLRALYVDHRLSAESGRWAELCEAVSRGLGIPFLRLTARVPRDGSGLEAAARRARYGLLAKALAPGEWLLLAHHAEDQAETILLRLLRGASPRLLAGMPAARPLGAGFLARPLLGLSRATLRAALAGYGLPWVEDPTNRDPRFDRGHLRREVLPALAARYPRWAERIAHAGRMIAAAVEALADLRSLGEGDTVAVPLLLGMPSDQAALMLELWLERRGLRPPPVTRIGELLRQLGASAPDRAPVLKGRNWVLRRHRDLLYLLPDPLPTLPPDLDRVWDGIEPLILPDASRLSLEGGTLRQPLPLRVRARRGGERILIATGGRRQSVKELLRASALPPWERQRLPLLWEGERLVAIGDRWLDAEFAAALAAAGLSLRHSRPLAGSRSVE